MANYPPNLATYVQNGFNAKKVDFVGAPIFGPLTTSDGNSVTYGWPQKTYDVPDGFMLSGVATFYTTDTKKVLDAQSNFQQDFAFSVGAKGKVRSDGIRVSASVKSSLAFHGKLFHETNQEYFVTYAVQTICDVERLLAKRASQGGPIQTKVPPCQDFQNAMAALPASPSTESDWERYYEFFDVYGTHFLLRGSLGGYFIIKTNVDKETVESEAAAEIAAAVDTSFNSALASGSLDVASEVKTSQFFSNKAEHLHVSYGVRGGIFSTDLHQWVQSCFRNPILVPGIQGISQPVLAPIAELFAEAQQPIVEQALRQYVFDKQILGEMKRLNFNQSYWSDTNELVCVNLTAVQGSWGWAQVKFISSAAAGGACSVDNVAGENADLPASSFLQVTYDGSNFSVNTVTSGGDTSSDAAPIGGSVLAFPLENPWKPGLCLGASEPISVASGYYTFPTDGLLEMFVSWNSGQGSVGWADTRDPAGNVVGACSVNNNNAASVQQYIPFATYTIPVLANTQYSFATQSSSGAPSFHPFFLPFTNGLAFGTACAVQAGVTQYAQTDGLLVGVMMYPPPTVNTKLVASLSLVSAPVVEALDQAVATAPTTNVCAGASVFGGTVTLPVRGREYYKAILNVPATSNDPEYYVYWVPLKIVGQTS